jgi:hypothetical protein
MAFQVSPGVNVSEIDLTTSVPGVALSVGAVAGVFRWGPVGERVLIDTETKLVETFGRPTSLNAETFINAANFLAYSSAMYVVRAANTTASTNSTLTAVANTVASVNNVSYTVKNRDDYDTKTFANSDVLYIARYPGDLGNSLRVSIVDNAASYQSDVLLANATSSVSNAVLSVPVGSNVATVTTTVVANGAAANLAANTFLSALNIGDVLSIGNTSIGTQYLKITAKSAPSVNATGNVATATINFATTYKLSTDFSITGSNTVNTSVQRSWEFFDIVDSAPSTSDYQAQFGNTSAVDTMHVVVVDEDGKFGGVAGSVLEVYQGVSRATDSKTNAGASNYYRDVINNGSRYVFVAGDRTGAAAAAAANLTSSTATSPAYISFVGGTDGLSESAVAFTDIVTAYDLFKTSEVDVSLILQGKPIGGVNSAQLANYLINNIAEVRKDCVVFVTPPDSLASTNVGNEATVIANWRNNYIVDSTYAFIDSGYKYAYDRYNDVYRYVPLNGDIAGLTARAEFTNDAWFSPAGFNRGQIKNVVKLRFNPTKADRDVLFKSAVNPVVTFPGQGTVLFGDKTATSKPSAFDRLNVRRLFIVLEKAISNSARFSLFEFNDDFTRSQFRNLVTPFLRDVQARRGITDFLVVCDETNNTPERIDRNEFWGDIYIKPARSISFIQLNFIAVRTGVEFNTVVGRF